MAKKKKNTNQKAKLTPKQERFCYEYLANGFNATQAAIKAGYSERTAKVIGSQNLTKLYIKERIEEMKKNLAETAGISALMIAEEHARIGLPSRLQNLDNKDKAHYADTKIEHRQRSLIELANLLGYNAPKKQELTGADGSDLFMQLIKNASK